MPVYTQCPNTVLSNIATKRFIGGAALQWAGKDMVERVHQTWPDLPLIQSENECGDGSNSYDYAIYIFDLMRHYLGNGVRGCECRHAASLRHRTCARRCISLSPPLDPSRRWLVLLQTRTGTLSWMGATTAPRTGAGHRTRWSR